MAVAHAELKGDFERRRKGTSSPSLFVFMIKRNNCFVQNEEKYAILFNPHNFSVAQLDNSECLKEEDIIDNLSDEIKNKLFEKQIFIQSDEDAVSISRYFSNKIKYGRKMTISDAMTFNCNMSCIYCFENGTKNNKKKLLPAERIKCVSNVIDTYAHDFDYLDYIFFGGEPMLEKKYIEQMCSFLNNKYKDKKILFSITSNGTLIDDCFINIANEYDFKEIRITLDGVENVHNCRRKMIDGSKSFALIINNINRLCKETNIRIVINTVMDSKNAPSYKQFIEYIVDEFRDYIITSSPRIVFNLGELCHPMLETEYTEKTKNDNSNSNILYYEFSEILLNKGATITSPFYASNCLNSIEKSFTISPDGSIYKCVTGLGSPLFLLTKYQKDLFVNDLINNNIIQIEKSHRAECFNCDFLTMCNGGCKCQHYENNYPLCRKELLVEELPYLMHLLTLGSFKSDGLFHGRNKV